MATPAITPNAGADDEYSTPIPQGGTTAPATVSTGTNGTSGPSEDEYSTPIPGAQAGASTSTPSAGGSDPLTELHAGIGQGVMNTLGGLATVGDKIGDKLESITGLPASGHGALASILNDQADKFKQEGNGSVESKIGYGGETLAEFMMGDEALKGLSMSDRLMQTSKAMKLLEKSPKLMNALKIGADAVNTSARTGAVQGAQTLARSGGDVEQAAKDAAVAGGTGAVLGGVTGAAGEILGNAGKTAQKATDLSEAAGSADTKEEVAKAVGEKIDTAKNQLHSDYETGINDLQDRLKGSEVSAQNNPLATKAKELLAKPDPDDHPLVSQAREVAGDRLDKKVRGLLEAISTGELPVEGGDAASGTAKPSGLVDASGKPLQSGEQAAQTNPAPPYKVGDLVKLRQTIRTLADIYDYGYNNSRDLRSLLGNPVDNTIEDLAKQSGDATAVSDYQALRSNYRDKINLFDEPVIQKLRDGKVDDAAKDFVGVSRDGSAMPTGGKVRFNVDALRGVIGDDGVHNFAKSVFGTMLKDSVDKGQFNPAKFVKTFNRVSDETKGQQFFDLEGANKGLGQLYKDAQSASNLQHLTRVGVLVPASAAVGGLTGGGLHVGIGALLGLTVAEGGGLQAGRDLLNYVANHPKVWDAYKAVGKAANSATAQGLATGVRGAAAQATPDTHVFNATQWASHPSNEGKDKYAAMAEARRQGYKVTQ